MSRRSRVAFYLSRRSTVFRRLFVSASDATRQKARFVLGGSLNAVAAFGIYSTLVMFLGESGYALAATVSHLISSFISFNLNRYLVFLSPGSYWGQLVRFQVTLTLVLVLNVCLLVMLVGWFGWNPILAQLTCLVPVSVASYYGHHLFSFRRR